MNFLNCWSNPKDKTIFKKNVEAISNFPENNPNAMIKADKNGKLYRAEKGFSWAFGHVFGTQLEETVKVIEKTAKHAMKDVQKKLKILPKKDKDKNAQKVRLRKISHSLSTEHSLLQGIAKIDKIYSQRYGKNANKKGLLELRSLKEKLQQHVEKSQETYSNSIREIREGNRKKLTQSILVPSPRSQISEEKAAGSLSNFCQKYCNHLEPAKAQGFINEGEKIFKDVMSGKKTKFESGNSEAECNALTWYLMSIAIDKKEGFEEGTFVIEDPQGRLYNYLKSAKSCYKRDSSHYKGRSAKNHLGIDVFNGNMPANKRTLLFEKVENPSFKGMPSHVLFLKPENYSARSSETYDFAMHGLEFVSAQVNKLLFSGSDDKSNMRKERVPSKELREFNRIVDHLEKFTTEEKAGQWLSRCLAGKDIGPLKGENLNFSNLKTLARKYGIAFMTRMIDHFNSYADKGGTMPADYNSETLTEMLKGYKDPTFRTGREVYISQKDYRGETFDKISESDYPVSHGLRRA